MQDSKCEDKELAQASVTIFRLFRLQGIVGVGTRKSVIFELFSTLTVTSTVAITLTIDMTVAVLSIAFVLFTSAREGRRRLQKCQEKHGLTLSSAPYL